MIWVTCADACTALCPAQLSALMTCGNAFPKIMRDVPQPRMQALSSEPTLCSGALSPHAPAIHEASIQRRHDLAAAHLAQTMSMPALGRRGLRLAGSCVHHVGACQEVVEHPLGVHAHHLHHLAALAHQRLPLALAARHDPKQAPGARRQLRLRRAGCARRARALQRWPRRRSLLRAQRCVSTEAAALDCMRPSTSTAVAMSPQTAVRMRAR